MKVVTSAFGFGLSVSLYLAVAMTLLGSWPGYAQKILRIEQTLDGIVVNNMPDDEAVHVTRGQGIHRAILKVTRPERSSFSYQGLPEQMLFQHNYRFPRPYAKGPDLTSRIKGGRTVEGGSRWASHIVAGRTVEQGSPFASAIPIGRSSRIPASASARGIAKFGMRGRRPPWASRLH